MKGASFDRLRINSLPRNEVYFGLALIDLEGSHLNSRIEYVQMSLGIPKSPVK
jgi:hypothetical protein